MHANKKWLLVSASSLVIIGAIIGSSRFLNEATAVNSKSHSEIKTASVDDKKQTEITFNNFNAQLVQNEQMKEDELKQSALKEVDSRTEFEKFSSDFTAYKDMHLKHSIRYENKQAKGNKISSKILNELEKKGELIAYFENELASNSKTGEQLLNEFHAAIEKLNSEL